MKNLKRFAFQSAIAIGLAVPLLMTHMSPAGFTTGDHETRIEIDGRDYGSFDQVTGLDRVGLNLADGQYHRISLTRDFVTDPSLYLWAKNLMRNRTELKDVHVIVQDSEGEEHRRYVLKFSQPLAWTVEAANPALGGFHEKIDLAVQEISIR